jgi:hypothetical protein
MVESSKGGNPPWASADQLAYLHSMKSTYNECKTAPTARTKKMTDFWITVLEHFSSTWPLQALTDEDRAAGTTDKTRQEKLKLVSENK